MDLQTLAASIAGTAAALTALVKLVPAARLMWETLIRPLTAKSDDTKATVELRASLKAVRRIAALKHVMEQFVAQKGLQRALLLTANNGGEAWKSAGPLYVSNPAQCVGPGEPNTQNLWQDWPCDAWYVEFLGRALETFERKRGLLLVSGIDTDGELKTQYEAQGTVAAVVLPFYWRKGGVLWYVSLNFGRAVEDGALPENAELHVRNAKALFDNPARVRALIDTLRAAFDSVR